MSQVAVHPAHRLGPQPELIWSKNTEAFEKNACSSTVIGFWENATYLTTTLGWEREAPQAFQSILVSGSAMPISFCNLTIQPLNVNENKICLCMYSYNMSNMYFQGHIPCSSLIQGLPLTLEMVAVPMTWSHHVRHCCQNFPIVDWTPCFSNCIARCLWFPMDSSLFWHPKTV